MRSIITILTNMSVSQRVGMIVLTVATAVVVAIAILSAPSGGTLERGQVESPNGSELSYLRAGDPTQQTIVLLHGLPETSDSFAPVAEAMAEDFFVIVPDLPGFGRSTLGAGVETSTDALAQELMFLLDHLEIDDVTLVVTDLGIIGLEWARTRPNTVTHVIAYETALTPFPANGTDIGPDAIEQAIVDENVLAERNYQAGTLRTLTDAEIQAARDSLDRKRRRLALALIADTLANAAPYPAIFDYLASTQTPLTVIAANPGTTLTPDQLRRLIGEQLPHAAVIDHGPGLHYLATDDPIQLATTLRAAIDRQSLGA